MFFDLDATFGEKDLLPKPRLPGPKTSKKHQGELSLLALLERRNGSREEWGRFVYHVLVEIRDWRNGFYYADCGCSFEYRAGNVYPNNVCHSPHETIWDANFDSDEEVLIAAAVRKSKAWYFQLPEARIAAEAWEYFARWSLIPRDYGYKNPKEWLGKVVTIEPEYGATCGCSFKFQEYIIEGIPWQFRKSRIILMVKYVSCGNYNNSCARPGMPIGTRASREINKIIDQYRVV